jgi:PKD repeat protein
MPFERLEERAMLAVVAWDGDAGDGLWCTPANWVGDVVPGESDSEVIDAAAAGSQVQIASGNWRIESVTSAKPLVVGSAVSPTVTKGTSTNSAAFTLSPGATLIAENTGTTFTGSGATTIDGASFYANDGATVSLPNLTTFTIPETPGDSSGEEMVGFGEGEQVAVVDPSVLSWRDNGDGTVTITGCPANATGTLTIPETIDGKSVTTIGTSAFRNCSSLTSVTIPDSVTTIGDGAFWGCSSLTSVTIGDSVTTIGYQAFWGCSSLTSVTIGDSVTTIGDRAFYNCSSLTSVTIGDSVTTIGDRAFSNCSSLTSVTIPDSVTTIGDWAFYNCSSLTSVTIGDSVTTIGDWAFYNCSSLTSVTIGDSVTTIGDNAFSYCSSLTSVTIGDSVTTIGDWAFYNCSSLTSVTIGDSVTTIGDWAFYNCSSLTSVTIGDSVTTIGDYAFYYCSSLTSVTIGDSVTTIGDWAFYNCSSLTSVTIGDSVTTIGDNAFSYCSSLTSVTIGDSVTTIGDWAFYNCSSLTSVTIGDSVTTIGDWAFSHCSSLTSVTIGDSVTTIGDDAFYNCSSLTSVTIGDSVTTIGDWAFAYCNSLTSVTIGDSVTTIGDGAFSGCSSLTSILVSSENTTYASVDGVLFNKDRTGLLKYPEGKSGAYVVPDSVTTIGDYAFYACSSLTSVTIGDSVTTIGDNAFSGCSSLTSVTIGDSVTTIGDYAFYGCRSLTSVTIGDSVTTIGDWAFAYCNSLTSVTIGDSVTTIGYDAFYGCSSLTSILVSSENTTYASVDGVLFNKDRTQLLQCPQGKSGAYVVPDSVTTIGDGAFAGCASLTSVTIGDSVTTIGNSAFAGCASLTSVTIGDSVTTIGDNAFSYCSSLTSVTIGDSVTTIGDSAFYNCSSLTSVTIGDSVTTIGDWAFYNCSSLTSVTIGDSVTTIGDDAFAGCSSLTIILVSSENTTYASVDGVLFNKDRTGLLKYPEGKSGAYVVPDSVTTIGDYAFYACSSLTSVTIGDSVTTIGDYAFYACSSLTSVTIEGDAPTSFGSGVFSNVANGFTIFYFPGASGFTTPTWNGYRTQPLGIQLSQKHYYQGNVDVSLDTGEIFSEVVVFAARGGQHVEIARLNASAVTVWDSTQLADGPVTIQAEYYDSGGELQFRTTEYGVIANEVEFTVWSGDISEDTTWGEGVVVITQPTTLVAGTTLTVGEGTTLKFCDGAKLVVESGAVLNSTGAIYTHIADDTAGGDTNADGEASQPRYNWGGIRGAGQINLSDACEVRYQKVEYSGRLTGTQVWNGHQVIHITSDVTVPSGVELTVQPGAIIKLNDGCSLIVESGGTLNAIGTVGRPITFTSIHDDSVGGDTNDNGEATRPQSGDWQSLSNNGTVNLTQTQVQFGGGGDMTVGRPVLTGMIQNSGNLTIDSSVIQSAAPRAVDSDGGIVSISNSIIRDSWIGAHVQKSSSVYRIVNSVFNDCTFALGGWDVAAANVTVSNSVFSDLVSVEKDRWEDSGGPIRWTLDHCAFWDVEGMSSAVAGNGNIWADPMFRDAAGGDFTLRPGSPLIDAADGTVAPETDRFGQPRVTDLNVPNAGTPNADGVYADIGAHEMTALARSDIDLTIARVDAPGVATCGKDAEISWLVTNVGQKAVSGAWRNQVFLVSEFGQQILVGTIESAGSIGIGESKEFSAKVTVPGVTEGSWRFVVQINSHRDLFEGQNVTNNRRSADVPTSLRVAELPGADANQTVTHKAAKLYRLTIPAGDSLLLSFDGDGPMTILASERFAPTDSSADYTAAAKGERQYVLTLPEAAAERTVYVRVSTQRQEVRYSVATEVNPFAVYGVSTDSISNGGTSTITVTGAGLREGMTFALQPEVGEAIPGTVVAMDSGSQASVRFDATGAAAGTYSLVVTSVDGQATETLADAVTIIEQAQSDGAVLEAWLDIPEAVREGRVYQGWAHYANTGDVDMLAPILYVESDTGVQFAASVEELESAVDYLPLLGVSPTGPAGILKPGEEARIPFYFVATFNTRIQLASLANGNTTIGLEHWSTWNEYHAAIADAATRLAQRGKATYDYEACRELAVRTANNDPTSAISGRLKSVTTGEPLVGFSITATSDQSGRFVESVTDETGFFSLTNLDHNNSYSLTTIGLCQLSMITVAFGGPHSDVNGGTITAETIGTIKGTVVNLNVDFSSAGIIVGAYSDDGTEYLTVTDTLGQYVFEGLLPGEYTVGVQTNDYRYTLPETGILLDNVVEDAIVDFTLQDGAILTGILADALTGAPIANAEVACTFVEIPGVQLTAISDEQGKYSIQGFPLGACQVNVYAEGWQAPQQRVVNALNPGETHIVDVSMHAAPIFYALPAGGVAPFLTTFEILDDSYSTGYTYAWDFDSDGVVDSTEATPSYEYVDPGEYTVTLVVTADGVSETYVAVDYIDVVEPIETVVKENVVVVDDDDAITIVSTTETQLVLEVSGSPSVPIAVDAVLVSQEAGGFARRIVGVSVEGNTYTLETVAAGIGEIFDSVQVSGVMELTDADMVAMGFERVLAAPLPEGEQRSANRAGDVWSWSGSAGISITTSASVKPTIDFELRWDDDQFYLRCVPKMAFELSASAEFFAEVAYSFDVSKELLIFKRTFVFWAGWVPILVPVEVPLSIGLEGGISGKFAASQSVSVAVTVGAGLECKNGEFDPILVATKTHSSQPATGGFTGSAHANIYGKLEAKASLFGISSIVVNAKRFVGMGIDVFPEPGATLKAGTTYGFEANVVDLEIGHWKLKYGYSVSHTNQIVLGSWKAAKAEFGASPTSGEKAPLAVSFKDKSEPGYGGVIKAWEWDFGDGTTSTLQNPRHTYDEEGEYEVTLTITGNGLTYTEPATKTILVGEKDEEDEENPDTPDSWDPNEIAGPVGYDTPDAVAAWEAWYEAHVENPDNGVEAPPMNRWISSEGQTLTYTVYFENLDTATAAAQEVFVDQQLDVNLDWSTFQMQVVVFSNQIIDAVSGMSNGSIIVDQDSTDYRIQIDTAIDYTTGEVDWYFRVVDPTTWDTWPADPYAGFLPPNDETHRGEGYITYTIDLKDDLPTGTSIESEADIIFDYNEVIVTNPSWNNCIDAGPPSSWIVGLPGVVNEAEFLVSWDGQDDEGGSGIGRYDVYVSTDHGPFTRWLAGTTESSAVFTGEFGRRYDFFTVATDNVGHREAVSYVADSGTYVNIWPVIGSLTASPAVVSQGGRISLTATDVGDADGSVVQVQFYNGDLLLGSVEAGQDGWS